LSATVTIYGHRKDFHRPAMACTARPCGTILAHDSADRVGSWRGLRSGGSEVERRSWGLGDREAPWYMPTRGPLERSPGRRDVPRSLRSVRKTALFGGEYNRS